MLIGITLVKNGNELGYPWQECIAQLRDLCDETFVNVGISSDETEREALAIGYSGTAPPGVLTLISQDWDSSPQVGGVELARQANMLLDRIPYKSRDNWILYLQADEFIHEKDFQFIRGAIAAAPPSVTQFELFRTYFWGSLSKRYTPHELWLGRLFRYGTHTIGGDGMYLNRLAGNVERLPIYIYHYSRIGTEEEVTKRLRNLDSFFHPKEVVDTFRPFTYQEAQLEDIAEHTGTHPARILQRYK